MDITGRKLFVKALEEEGVDTIFAYPGGTVTDLFDELYKTNSINLVLPRHEQGLIHEAEGYAKSTGKVGVCLVTSGPGATNTVTGLADAHYDNVPLVCFTGQVPLPLIGNDAFQEVDIVGITRNITKYSVTVRDRKELGKIIKMAFHIARTGKPGPVLIDLPKDIRLYCVIIIGFVKSKKTLKEKVIYSATHKSNKPYQKMLEACDDKLPEYAEYGLKMVEKAPSEVNRRPVKFRFENGVVSASVDEPYSDKSIDFGIAKLHFQLGASAKGVRGEWKNGKFLIDDNKILKFPSAE